jgi:FtsH-binding integral membrane protein
MSFATAQAVFISAGIFAAMSLYEYSTGRDLLRFGSFLFMGLVGIVLASLVDIFVASSMLHFAILAIGVLVFVGLTACDTQKEIYFSGRAGTELAKSRYSVSAPINPPLRDACAADGRAARALIGHPRSDG